MPQLKTLAAAGVAVLPSFGCTTATEKYLPPRLLQFSRTAALCRSRLARPAGEDSLAWRALLLPQLVFRYREAGDLPAQGEKESIPFRSLKQVVNVERQIFTATRGGTTLS